MTLIGLLVLLVVVVLLIALIQQIGVIPGLFAPGTSLGQRLAGAVVFAILVVLIVWLVSHFLPGGGVRLT